MTERNPQLELAEYLAETYFPHDPVQPLELARRNGITSSFGDYEDAFDGLLELKRDRFHMYLNREKLQSLEYPRTRFTAAHELGHYFIDDHRHALMAGVRPHPSFTEFVTDLTAEREADEFAASLLMPPGRFTSAARKKDVSLDGISELASMFGTSMMSTAIRYARTDVSSVSVMLWAETERRWCWSSKDVWTLTKNWAYKKTEKVPDGSATKDVLNSPVPGELKERGTVLSQWFPGIRAGTVSDKTCREQARQLGQFGVMTLLEILD